MSNSKIPLIAAHRGSAGGNIPCNSESAFKAALLQGADIIELDVAVSRDRKLFVFHPGKEFAYLNMKSCIAARNSKKISGRVLYNCDRVVTKEKILMLDDALELLKGKCIVNVDKFWTAPKEISDCIRRHKMEDQVILKTSAKTSDIDALAEVAADMPYMVIVKNEDKISNYIESKKINFIGVESCFTTDTAPAASDEYIKSLHKKGLKIWGNSIVYDYRDVISGGHTDDIAMVGDKENGWGWFMDKGFDIVQTDWCLQLKQYFNEKAEK